MPAPTVTSIFPSSGHTGGRTLVTIRGTGFALPSPPAAHGPTTTPVPSVAVTIGGAACSQVQVVSSTLLRCLTPIHDPSGIPATDDAEAIPASDLVVANVDSAGAPISGQSATLPACYSFRRPVFNETVTTQAEVAIKALMSELQRQVHPNVVFQPHTDYTAEGAELVTLASLPGIALQGLRLPTSRDVADREQPEVDLGDGTVAVRRQPIIRDAVMTCLVASDDTSELLWLDAVIAGVAKKNPTIGGWTLDYQRGEPVTFTDRQAGVVYFMSEFAIRRIQETDIPGLPVAGTALDRHEATVGIAYKVGQINVGTEEK